MNSKEQIKQRFPFATIDEVPGFLVWQSSMCWLRIINQALQKQQLTYTQFIVLLVTSWLNHRNEKTYQHHVAKTARIDRMMTSRIMNSLEQKKYIKRVKQSNDARTNQVFVTETGSEALTQAMRINHEMEQDFFKPTTAIGKDFVNYMQTLLPEC